MPLVLQTPTDHTLPSDKNLNSNADTLVIRVTICIYKETHNKSSHKVVESSYQS